MSPPTTAPLDQSAVEIAVLDKAGRIVAVNAAWNAFCAANGGDLPTCGPGTSYLGVCEAVHDRTTLQIGAALRAILRGAQLSPVTFTIPCDGIDDERWFDISLYPRLDDRAEVAGATVVLWRVDQPPAAFTAVRRLAMVPDEGVVWDLIEAFPDGTVLVDDAGIITHANRELEHLSGFARTALVGQPIEMLLPERVRSRHVSWTRGYRAAPRVRAMAAGIELQLRRADGYELPVEISLAPVRIGAREMTMASVRDVSAQRTEHGLRTDRATLVSRITALALADIAPEAIYHEVFLGVRSLLESAAGAPSAAVGVPPSCFVPAVVREPGAEPTAEELTRAAISSAVQAVGWEGRTPDETEVLDDLARQVALVMDLGVARHDRERLQLLEDRQRIGRDLHDTVIQAVIGIGLQLAASATTSARDASLVEQLEAVIVRLRLVVFDTRESEPDDDLVDLLSSALAGAARTLGHEPSLVVEGDVDRVPPEVVNHLLPVLREALSNVVRHARAARTTVRLSVGDRTVELWVQDDGRGLVEGPAGSGTTNFRERAEMLGGTSVLGPAPGRGTRLTWIAPLRHADAAAAPSRPSND